MTEPPSKPPADKSPDEPDDDWDDDWDDWNERRILGMVPRTALWVVMTVGVAAALIVIIVVAVINSGNSSPTQAATGVPTDSVAPSQPTGQVTCSVLTADPNLAGRYTFVPAPLNPPNVLLPALPPKRQCTGSPNKPDSRNPPDIVALIWPGAAVDTYSQQLLGAGWTSNDVRGAVSFFTNTSASYEIALLEVNGALVALYNPV